MTTKQPLNVDVLLVPRIDRLSVLIAEDDALMAKLTRDMLIQLGFNAVAVVSNGAEALRYIRSRPVDIVICDWQMSPISGLDLTRHLRCAPDSPNPAVPIIMMTGRAELAAVTRARDLGVTEYLLKPITLQALCDRIVEVVERPRDFVLSPGYIGPDRRRREGTPPGGKERRKALQEV